MGSNQSIILSTTTGYLSIENSTGAYTWTSNILKHKTIVDVTIQSRINVESVPDGTIIYVKSLPDIPLRKITCSTFPFPILKPCDSSYLAYYGLLYVQSLNLYTVRDGLVSFNIYEAITDLSHSGHSGQQPFTIYNSSILFLFDFIKQNVYLKNFAILYMEEKAYIVSFKYPITSIVCVNNGKYACVKTDSIELDNLRVYRLNKYIPAIKGAFDLTYSVPITIGPPMSVHEKSNNITNEYIQLNQLFHLYTLYPSLSTQNQILQQQTGDRVYANNKYFESNVFQESVLALEIIDIIYYKTTRYIKCKCLAVRILNPTFGTLLDNNYKYSFVSFDVPMYVYFPSIHSSIKYYSVSKNHSIAVYGYKFRNVFDFYKQFESAKLVDLRDDVVIKPIPGVVFHDRQVYHYNNFRVIIERDCDNIDDLISNRSLSVICNTFDIEARSQHQI